MTRASVSVLTSGGARLYYVQRNGESVDEFRGRYRCQIEDHLFGAWGISQKGIRWAEWDHDGHPLGRFCAHGFGVVKEHMGNRYQDRTIVLQGRYTLPEVCEIFGLPQPTDDDRGW